MVNFCIIAIHLLVASFCEHFTPVYNTELSVDLHSVSASIKYIINETDVFSFTPFQFIS